MDERMAKRVLDVCDGAVLLSGDAREAFLVQACAGDSELRSQADELLQAIEDSGSFMRIDGSKAQPSD